MGKFAGFLKRAKKIAGFAGGVLNGLNKVYKAVQPFTEDIVGALPFGNYINKGLNVASKVVDKVALITKNWLEDEDKASDDEQRTVTEESIKAKIRGATWTFLPSHKSCVCEITMKNGFTVRGESAIVDERYFDPDVAKKISYEDAFRKIWALEGYLLQEMLYLAAEKQSKNEFPDMSEL